MRPARRRLVFLALTVSALLLVIPVRDVFFRQMLYPAPYAAVPSPPPAPFEEVALPIPSGETAAAWFAEEPEPGTALLVFHGNGENLGTMAWSGVLDLLRGLGVSVLAVDYPGYGRSTGKPSEAANLEAADAALAWLGERRPQDRKIVWGSSLGAAVAVQTAARHPDEVAGLIALSPWESLAAIAREHYPSWLVSLVLSESYDSRNAAAGVGCPALVVHGERDRIIPAAQGQAVAEALPRLHRWVAVPNAGHNDLLSHRRVWAEMEAFLRTAQREP